MLPRCLQHAMTRLAIMAMLLLVVLPTVGRVFGGTGMDMPMGDMAAHARHHGNPAPDEPQHPAGDTHHGDGLCPYCPLLASLLAVPLLLVCIARITCPTRDWPWHDFTAGFVAPNGLGPRGPPQPL